MKVKAEDVNVGDFLIERDQYVEEITSNSLGDVILRCSYSKGSYPATSLLMRPEEIMEIRR